MQRTAKQCCTCRRNHAALLYMLQFSFCFRGGLGNLMQFGANDSDSCTCTCADCWIRSLLGKSGYKQQHATVTAHSLHIFVLTLHFFSRIVSPEVSSTSSAMAATFSCAQKAALLARGPAPRSSRSARRSLQYVRALPEVASLCLDGQQAGLIAGILKPTVAIGEFFFIMRIIMSWDPQYNTGDKLPWAIFYKPTEPVLAPTRKVIQPIGGVDISPIVWTFILSLMNEILLGPQGILVLIERQGGL